jgi:arylsulfatase A-like enzyme
MRPIEIGRRAMKAGRKRTIERLARGATLLFLIGIASAARAEQPEAVVIVTVDALRADRLSGYGYERRTSPEIDALLDDGLRFDAARTVEPLTGPAMCSMITGSEPHEHGATRNGLRIREGLESLPRVVAAHGWETAAFVSNWTLKDKLTRLAGHFDHYGEVFTRRRWFGLLNSEATAEDVTDGALEWISVHRQASAPAPFLMWVHFVEPHAPYRFHEEYADRLGITDRDPKRQDRYDTEVAAVDAAIGRLIRGIEKHVPPDGMIVVFAADHGESLGEHDYWGHGRYLYEPSLRIPLGLRWKGTVEQRVIERQATILDIAPTVLDLLGYDIPDSFDGISWADAARGRELPPVRTLCYQAHKGAVHGEHDVDRKRSKGLLSVGIVNGDRKEILRVKNNSHSVFDLEEDPAELVNLVEGNGLPSDSLLECLGVISEGLGALDRLTANKLDDETIEQLKALGYIDEE